MNLEDCLAYFIKDEVALRQKAISCLGGKLLLRIAQSLKGLAAKISATAGI